MTTAIPPRIADLLRGDVLMRLQRAVGLAPADGLGVARRALFWALFAWLPVAVWAWQSGHLRTAGSAESFLTHYSVSVRLLVAVPLMVIAEAVLLGNVVRIATQFAAMSLYRGDRGTLEAAALGLARLRDRVHPWAAGLGASVVWAEAAIGGHEPPALSHETTWASGGDPDGFGVLWYLWVARPIFGAFVAIWLWRALLLGITLRRLCTLGIAFVPTHPDRVGGLGFMATLPMAFGVVAFALSSVIGAVWAHDVAHHGLAVSSLKLPMVATVVLLTVVFLAPLGVLVGPMTRARALARLQYGALVARYGAGVHRRWIGGEEVDDPLLDAPEIGPSADVATLYAAVCRMLPAPFPPAMILSVALPAALPMVAVVAMEVPVAVLVKRVLDALL